MRRWKGGRIDVRGKAGALFRLLLQPRAAVARGLAVDHVGVCVEGLLSGVGDARALCAVLELRSIGDLSVVKRDGGARSG